MGIGLDAIRAGSVAQESNSEAATITLVALANQLGVARVEVYATRARVTAGHIDLHATGVKLDFIHIDLDAGHVQVRVAHVHLDATYIHLDAIHIDLDAGHVQDAQGPCPLRRGPYHSGDELGALRTENPGTCEKGGTSPLRARF